MDGGGGHVRPVSYLASRRTVTIAGKAWACEGKATTSSSPTTLRSLGEGRTTVEEETLVVLLARWGGRIETGVANPHLIRLE